MEIIFLPSLRVGQLQTFAESSINICKNIPELQEATQIVTTTLGSFIEGALKGNPPESRKGLDLNRDRFISGFTLGIKAELVYPYTSPEAINTQKQLAGFLTEYGTKISRLPFDEETSVIDNMLTAFNKINLDSLSTNNIKRWIPLLEEANSNFKEKTAENIEDSAETDSIASATKQAPKLLDALEGLFLILVAKTLHNPSEAILKAHTEIKILVDSYK